MRAFVNSNIDSERILQICKDIRNERFQNQSKEQQKSNYKFFLGIILVCLWNWWIYTYSYVYTSIQMNIFYIICLYIHTKSKFHIIKLELREGACICYSTYYYENHHSKYMYFENSRSRILISWTTKQDFVSILVCICMSMCVYVYMHVYVCVCACCKKLHDFVVP